MIFDDQGRILWHQGRLVSGEMVGEGIGFSREPIRDALTFQRTVKGGADLVSFNGGQNTESAIYHQIKCSSVIPAGNHGWLYFDSVKKASFCDEEMGFFTATAEMFGQVFDWKEQLRTSEPVLIGDSPSIVQVRDRAVAVAMEGEPVLITGETGCGKNRLAEWLHELSARRGQMVVAHTPTIPEPLFESILFGHGKGAFTGADREAMGLLRQAEGGTLLIDEIGEIPLSAQTKLLRFIETRKFLPLGAKQEVELDVRVIVATNRDLRKEIMSRNFRDDLYFRLNTFSISIPPLRERREDIPQFVRSFQQYLHGKTITAQAMNVLQNHDWPGNVRELIAVMKRAGVLLPNQRIGKEISSILDTWQREDLVVSGTADRVDRLWQELVQGGDFWAVVKKPFLARDISRGEVRAVVAIAREQAGDGSRLVDCLPSLGIPHEELKKFLDFLRDYRIL